MTHYMRSCLAAFDTSQQSWPAAALSTLPSLSSPPTALSRMTVTAQTVTVAFKVHRAACRSAATAVVMFTRHLSISAVLLYEEPAGAALSPACCRLNAGRIPQPAPTLHRQARPGAVSSTRSKPSEALMHFTEEVVPVRGGREYAAPGLWTPPGATCGSACRSGAGHTCIRACPKQQHRHQHRHPAAATSHGRPHGDRWRPGQVPRPPVPERREATHAGRGAVVAQQ